MMVIIMKYYIPIIILLAIILTPSSLADNSGHMTLLAVSEKNGEEVGNTADLYLEIREGTGRSFIDTFPLTKFDTQISVRFAKEIACSLIDEDCSEYDFFYTIRSDSVIIGGPSAGAALSVLTMSVVEDWDKNEDIAITGTINPGGFIGTVGGIKEKILAAAEKNISKVIIPKGTAKYTETNKTDNSTYEINLHELATENNIELIEVTNIEEVVYEYSGKLIERKNASLKKNEEYEKLMTSIGEDLCKRTSSYLLIVEDKNNTRYLDALNLSEKSKIDLDNGAYYPAASYCFGANIKLKHQILLEESPEKSAIVKYANKISQDIRKLELEINNRKILTITDLQASLVVKERLKEAKESLEKVKEGFENNATNTTILYHLAYAKERTYSSYLWSRFMNGSGKEYEINDDTLRESCMKKLSEAEERFQYATLYIPGITRDSRIDLNKAYTNKNEGKYAECLFSASKAKAESDLILAILSINNETKNDYLDLKLRAIENSIAIQQEEGIFPILGFSYYEYAKSLRTGDIASALLYAEYSIELSSMDLYFKEQKEFKPRFPEIDLALLAQFILGSIFGSALTFSILNKRKKTSKKSKKKLKKK